MAMKTRKQLQDENKVLTEENEELNMKLDAILDLAAVEDDDDDEEADDEDEDEET